MKFHITKFTDKVTAVMIFIVVIELAIGVALGISCMFDYHFYASDRDTYALSETCRVKSESDIEEIAEYCRLYSAELGGETLSAADRNTLDTYRIKYSAENSNVRFIARSSDSSVILTNTVSGEKSEGFIYETYGEILHFSPDGRKTVTAIKFGVLKELVADDEYKMASRLISIAIFFRYPLIVLFAILVIVALVILGMLMSSVKAQSDKNKKHFIDKLPIDLLAFFMGILLLFFGALITLTNIAEVKTDNIVLWNAIILIIAFFVSIFVLVFNISVATRIKEGHFFKNTLIFKAIVAIRKKLGKKNEGYFKVPFIGKAFITIGIMSIFEIGVTIYYIYRYFTVESGLLDDFKFMNFVLIWAGARIILIPILYMISSNINYIRESGQRLAEGDLQYDVESDRMFGDFRKIGGDLTKIKDEIIKAIDAKNKSLTVRDELITNLSHDIKTPLTSIVNYADLLKRGNFSDEEFAEYLQIIDNQSYKLKKLLENLIEVSKLTTGDVAINLEPVDIVMFTSQMISEYEDRFESEKLQVVQDYKNDPLFVTADANQLFRVFENLFGNVIKYAKPDTRVFVRIEREENTTHLSVSNISRDLLEKDEQELLQRFSRGDASRHTEGHGLGLSIAKTLVEFQGGSFSISLDADMFKTEFRLNNAEALPEAYEE